MAEKRDVGAQRSLCDKTPENLENIEKLKPGNSEDKKTRENLQLKFLAPIFNIH